MPNTSKKFSQKCSLYLIDDNPTFLQIIIHYLRREKRITIAGTALSAETAILEVGALNPDVILLDLAMPGMNGIEALPHLHKIAGQSKIIMLSLFDSENERRAALTAGAHDFIFKAEMLTELMPAIWKAVE